MIDILNLALPYSAWFCARVRIRGHADQRDMADPERTAGVFVKTC
jgi:hypothetical protein